MVGESNGNVFLIQIDASKLAEFEISEFEISRFECMSSVTIENKYNKDFAFKVFVKGQMRH